MEAEKTRSIRLPEKVWDALDEDAARCRRSSQKQIEALLVSFYEMGDVDINKQSLEILGQLFPRSNKPLPLIEARAAAAPKKKKTA